MGGEQNNGEEREFEFSSAPILLGYSARVAYFTSILY